MRYYLSIYFLLFFTGTTFASGMEDSDQSPGKIFFFTPIQEQNGKVANWEEFPRSDVQRKLERSSGFENRKRKGFNLYHKVAKKGDRDAQFNVAVMYDQGHGVQQNVQKALKWYLKAANQGDEEAQLKIRLITQQSWKIKFKSKVSKYYQRFTK